MPIGAFKLNSIARALSSAPAGRTAVTMTANGNAKISTAQSKFGGSSSLFDGTGDYLSSVTGSVEFGSSDFTIEGWIYLNGNQNTKHLMGVGLAGGSNRSAIIFLGGTQKIEGYFSNNGSSWTAYTFGNTTVTANAWHHIAIVKTSSTIKVFLDGVDDTGSQTGTPTGTAYAGQSVYIGGDTTYQANAYIDEVRFSNTAKYTTTFTPSTNIFVNDANTLLLLHMNGTDGINYFIDDNGVRSSMSIIANGNAAISTAQSKFGDASALFDGTGDYLNISPTTDLAFGSSDFTIEFWVRTKTTKFTLLFDGRPASTTGAYPCIYTDASGIVYYNTNNANAITGSTLSINTWYHIAVSRSGTSTKLFVNGTQSGLTYTDSTTYLISSLLRIGAGQYSLADYLNGYIDEIRISNSARYTTTFTPSTTAFVNDSNTLLLIHADGGNDAKVFIDDNGGTYATITSPVTLLGGLNPANSTGTTITIPSDALVGDIAILSDSSTTTTLTVPSGWTQISTVTTTGIRTTVSYRVLTSGNPGSSVTGMAGVTRKVMKILRPSASNYTLSLSTPTTQATTAVPTAQTISGNTTSTADAYIATYGSTGSIVTRTFTQSGYTADETGAVSTSSVYQNITIMNQVTASSASISMSDNGTNTLQGVRITLTTT